MSKTNQESRVIREIMREKPVSLEAGATARDAARAMREHDIGSVIVEEGSEVRGIVTDRDLVVRCIAEDGDAQRKLGSLCTEQLVKLSPEDEVDTAVRLMEKKAIRRIPVIENGRAVGIVSLGDLAQERQPKSALGRISAAPPNR